MNIELLLEDFCHYSRHIRGVSPNTIIRYKQKVGAFLRIMDIDNTEQINEKLMHQFFLKGRVERSWSTATYRTYFMTLIAFFKWSVKHGYMEETYLGDIELPIRKTDCIKECLIQVVTELILSLSTLIFISQVMIRHQVI